MNVVELGVVKQYGMPDIGRERVFIKVPKVCVLSVPQRRVAAIFPEIIRNRFKVGYSRASI
jgi:hypothetical protein